MNDTEVRDLVRRAKSEPEAFGQLYEHYVRRIYNYHYRHTSNRVEAEDLTSRTFYRALRSLHRYREKRASFQAWLFRIAHNLVVNWYRDHGRRDIVSIDTVEPMTSQAEDPHDFVEALEEQAFLQRVLATLSEDRKTLILLKFVEKMTNREIAEVLGRTEGAVKALYYRTLVDLRETMTEDDDGGR
jgi:RNA polymerase sigma-70 factor (ECF subfamily)